MSAKKGDKVKVDYTGMLDDGSIFDSTKDREPFEFVLGQAHTIAGFQKAIEGMNPGDSKTVKVPPEEAYGMRRKEMILSIDRNNLPQEIEPHVGQQLHLNRSDGTQIGATVAEISESAVTVDTNHPLAGETLTFEISLLELA